MSKMRKLLSVYSIVMAGLFLFGVFTSFLWSPNTVLASFEMAQLAPELALIEPSAK